jgi:hypothetical protein
MFGSKKALLLLANGSEESEVVITVDVRTKLIQFIYFLFFS